MAVTTPKAGDSWLGTQLRSAREAAGLTQLDAVVGLRYMGRPNISTSTVQRWEYSGSVKLDDAILLAGVYGISLEQLAGLR